jgi:tripartite-type tricarboxylate transporter receptor subunit TctC
MQILRRGFLQLTASAATLAASSLNAWALDYPTRAIHWVIGFPPGGGADIVARIMGAWLSERLGQQIIIENKPGAATNIATQTVINSPADGYTLLWAGISNVINATIYGTLPFDFLRDIAPVSGMVVYPMVFEVNPSVPAKNLPELIAYAKANHFTGVGVPIGTPEPIIARLNHEINAGLKDPAINARLAELMVTPLVVTPAEFGAYMAAETAKWAKVIKLANIKAD